MSSPALRITSLPPRWFERPQYAPQIELDGRRDWFLFREDFAPFRDLSGLTALAARNATRPADVTAALRSTRERWKLPHSPDADTALRTIDTQNAAMVVGGQQPGFLGGPLYTLYKAISTIALARRQAEASKRPCVPVFWVASEDHDLEEVRRARFPSSGPGETEFALPHVQDRRPVSEYPIDAESREVLEEAKLFLAHRRHGDLAAELIDSYVGGNVASGFARMLTTLLGGEGLLVIDPSSLREYSTSLVRVVLENAGEVIAAIRAGREKVQALGLRPFVAERYPLFLIDEGKRHYLEPVREGFRWAEHAPVPTSELVGLLEASPERFSPGALLRPLVQQSVLPSVLAVGGPAEIGYHAQLGPLARLLDAEVPRIALRLHATLVDGRDARVLDTVPLSRLVNALSADALLGPGDEVRALARLEEQAESIDATLRGALDALPQGKRRERLARKAARMRQDIASLGEQIASERRSLRAEESRRAAALWKTLFPADGLQERHWSFLHYVAKHGRDWISELVTAVATDPLSLAHRLVVFGPSA